MRFLLTSAGISNKSIENALRKLVGPKMKIAFIPTAAGKDAEKESWLVRNINDCKKLGEVEVTDIAFLKKDEWLPRLKWANVIFVGGGDTSYLMKWIWKSGLAEELPKLLKTRVYVGISAGSMIISKAIQGKSEHLYGDETKDPPPGLNLIDFQIRPHLNSPSFRKITNENLKELSETLDGDLYALDDNSAVLYDNGKIEIVSEGKWIKFSQDI